LAENPSNKAKKHRDEIKNQMNWAKSYMNELKSHVKEFRKGFLNTLLIS